MEAHGGRGEAQHARNGSLITLGVLKALTVCFWLVLRALKCWCAGTESNSITLP
jgi:hypothetical protein